jgi:hypothetical protein
MKQFCTYFHFIDKQLVYIGEGTLSRPWDFKERRPDQREKLEQLDIDVVIVGTHGDKVSSELNEQGLISWIGIENLWNKIPYSHCGYPSMGFLGKKHTSEWIEKQRQRRLGQKHSEESKRKMSAARTGTTVSEITKQKISETKKNRKLKCPHCGMLGGVSNMRRYHFDNCKQNHAT